LTQAAASVSRGAPLAKAASPLSGLLSRLMGQR